METKTYIITGFLTAWSNNDRFDFTFADAHDINTARDTSTEETIKTRLKSDLIIQKRLYY